MAKKVLLVDNELKIVECILKQTDWIIEVLITQQKNNRYRNNMRVKKIYTENDFWNNYDMSGFKYEDLYPFWHAQLKVENCFNRALNDYQLGKWSYYRGFALVHRIYEEHEIDFVIVKGLNHGWIFDRLVTDMASQKGINNYNIGCIVQYKRSIYNNLTNELLPVNASDAIDMRNSVFYNLPQTSELDSVKGFKGYLAKVIYKFFGILGVKLVVSIKNRNLDRNIFGVTVFDQIREYWKLKCAKKYLDSVAVDLDMEKNYICYALHLEPEAAVAGMAEMDSQIAVIQMLASSLPRGWTLYVKEHPHQFNINRNESLSSYLYASGVFKTKYFYQEIKKIKNVQFLKTETDMKKIIENSCAMATMTGTIAAESVSFGKPVMVFAPDRTIYKLSKGFYNIWSLDDCKNAIEKIVKHEPVCYDDFEEVCNKYLIDFSNESVGFQNAIKVVKADVEKRL